MSEYDMSCAKCNKFLMVAHTSDWNDHTLCSKCWREQEPISNCCDATCMDYSNDCGKCGKEAKFRSRSKTILEEKV